jgi:hypothetical protein
MAQSFIPFGFPSTRGLANVLRTAAKGLMEDEAEDVSIEVRDGHWRIHMGGPPDGYDPPGALWAHGFVWWDSDTKELSRRLIEQLIVEQAIAAEAEEER